MPAIKHAEGKGVNGIGGIQKATEMERIRIPFVDLEIIIYVQFHILPTRVPKLLSMKDMLDNGLDISVQHRNIEHKVKTQQLILEDYLLIHNGPPKTSLLPCIRKANYETNIATSDTRISRPRRPCFDGNEETGKIQRRRRHYRKYGEQTGYARKTRPNPKMFKLTIGTNSLRFNHTVELDTM